MGNWCVNAIIPVWLRGYHMSMKLDELTWLM